MAVDNTVTIAGNVTRDPELRFTPNGAAVASFSVAVNRRWRNAQSGEYEEQTSFFDITAWKDLAQNLADSIHKGDRVVVMGRIEQRSWEDADSGDKRSKIEVVADDVAVSMRWATTAITKVARNSNTSNGQQQQAQPARQPVSAGPPPYSADEEPF